MSGNLAESRQEYFCGMKTAKYLAHDSAGQANGRTWKRKKIKTENKLRRVGAKVRRE